MKTILGIMGSPRTGGNTQVLLDRIMEGARDAGAVTEVVFLGELSIAECDGCHACWQGHECPKRDDMNPLFARIAKADALVLATPVYWYGPTALMKAFIDRLVYFNGPDNRPKIRGKRAAVVIPFEETDPATAAGTVEFFEKCCGYLEMKMAGRLIVPGVTRRGEVRRQDAAMTAAFNLGAALATD
jgi:multimeric flavodoxin WrbA